MPKRHRYHAYVPIQTELSPRELDVLWLFGHEGESAKRTAKELGISLETCRSYIKRIRVKLRIRGVPADSRVDLFMAALSECIDRPETQAAIDDLLSILLSEEKLAELTAHLIERLEGATDAPGTTADRPAAEAAERGPEPGPRGLDAEGREGP